MENDCLVNFKVPVSERESYREEAKKKGFKNMSAFLRFIVRKNFREVEFNKDGLYNG